MPNRYKRNPDRWRATWYDDAGRQKSKGRFTTKAQAKAYEEQMAAAKAEGLLDRRMVAMSTPLREWIVEWWQVHMDVPGRPGNTLKNYGEQINVRIDPYIGGVAMGRLDTPRIAAWRDELIRDGHTPYQVGRAMQVLSSCLKMAGERGLLPNNVNPVRDATPPKTPPRRIPRPLSAVEVERLRLEFLTYRPRGDHDDWSCLRSATITGLAAYGGLRPGEYLGAKVRDVDFEANGIWVRDVFAMEHREGDTKTHAGRFVRLDAQVMADLRLWLEVRGGDLGDWLFPDTDGNVTERTHRNWRRPFRGACTRAATSSPAMANSLRGFRPYDLRHTCVSLELRAGNTSPADLAARMGHTVQTMIDRYTHVIESLRGVPVRPVAEQLAEAREQVGTPAAMADVHARLMASRQPATPLIDFSVARARRRAG